MPDGRGRDQAAGRRQRAAGERPQGPAHRLGARPAERDPLTVHIYVNGRWGGEVRADVPRPDIGAAFPSAARTTGSPPRWIWAWAPIRSAPTRSTRSRGE